MNVLKREGKQDSSDNSKLINKNSERVEYIDLLRAFGIILMIMGHIGFGFVFDKWIHAFHMPMFFVISGYFYKKCSIRQFLKNGFHRLILPYCFFSLIHLILYYCMIGRIDKNMFFLIVYDNTSDDFPIAGALWFLTALFFVELIYRVIDVLLRGKIQLVVIFLISLLGMKIATFGLFELPLALDIGLVSVGFYQIGVFLKEKWKKILKLKLSSSLILLLVCSCTCFLNNYVNVRKGLYGNWLLFWINAGVMTIAWWNIAKAVYEWLYSTRILKIILNWIIGIGRDSIVYLCLNQLVIYCVQMIIDMGNASSFIYQLLFKIFILFISLIVLHCIQNIIMKDKIKFVMGR